MYSIIIKPPHDKATRHVVAHTEGRDPILEAIEKVVTQRFGRNASIKIADKNKKVLNTPYQGIIKVVKDGIEYTESDPTQVIVDLTTDLKTRLQEYVQELERDIKETLSPEIIHQLSLFVLRSAS